MGSNRKLIFGAVLVVAGLVFWGLMNALNGVNRVAKAPTPIPATQVAAPQSGRMIAYAKSNIPPGTLVTKNMFEMRELPGSAPTSPFITNPEAQALGYITKAPIPKGALIRPTDDFSGHISEVGIAGMLQPGTRAIVIPFANKPTLHDLVAIGDRIDVNAAFDGQEARTIVPNVRVLAVDVFGSDFPQVNIARRGAFKADAQISAAPAPVETSGAPGATPTPTPGPAQGAARPEPAVTLEVTPEQANRILLAQASGGVMDFVVLPTRELVLVDSQTSPNGVGPDGQPIGNGIGQLVSAVTRPQIAPYAERKKAAGGGAAAPATRIANASERLLNSANRMFTGAARNPNPRPLRDVDLPSLPPVTVSPGDASGANNGPGLGSTPSIPAESPTYNIPIYADGRTVRVETVPRPQD